MTTSTRLDRLRNIQFLHVLERASMEVIRAEILEDRTCFRRTEADTLLAHHPLDGFFPSFGCGPLPGNTQEISFIVFGVADAALADDQLIGDRDAQFVSA